MITALFFVLLPLAAVVWLAGMACEPTRPRMTGVAILVAISLAALWLPVVALLVLERA